MPRGILNGGLFTYLLWAERATFFAAFAPSAALLAHGYQNFKPKPVLHRQPLRTCWSNSRGRRE